MIDSTRRFRIVLLISIFVHSVFLLELPRLKVVPPQKALTNLEITYQKLKIKQVLDKELLKTMQTKITTKDTNQDRHLAKAKELPNPPAFSEQIADFDSGKIIIRKIQTPQIKEKSFMEIVKLPTANSPIMKNPAYVSYYQIIREKIKSVVYLDSSLAGNGAVYLSFVVDSKGELKALRVVEENSINNEYLRHTAYDFVEKASPFPPFPSELKHPQLSFNVIIEFRITD